MKMIKVPADSNEACTEVDIKSPYPDLKADEPLGVGGWIERVNPRLTIQTPKGPLPLVFIVDEEGLVKQKPHNARANNFYPHSPIAGDAYFCLEDMTPDGPDFVSLPENFSTENLMILAAKLRFWDGQSTLHYEA